jgi:hypothetical protein
LGRAEILSVAISGIVGVQGRVIFCVAAGISNRPESHVAVSLWID